MSTYAFPGAGLHGWWMAGADDDDPRDRRRRQHGERGGEAGRRGRRRGPDGGGFGPAGFGPGGFGPGGFGPGGFGHRGGGRGHGPWGRPGRGRRGDVRAAILALLNEGPRNGYQLITDISERTDELWKPSPGSVYPALAALEDEGLIEPTEVDGKKLFQLSAAGRTYVGEHVDELTDPWDAVSKPWEGMLRSRKPMMQIGMALQQVALSGDAELTAAARKVLDETVRSLYRLLAEQSSDEPGADEPDGDEPGGDEPGMEDTPR